jgi:hypothetical protein
VHDRGDPGEQRLVVDLVDEEAVVPFVDQVQVGPPTLEDHAPPVRTNGVDGHLGDIRGAVHGHAAETDVHRFGTGVQERDEVGGERSFVGEEPGTGLDGFEVGGQQPRVEDGVRREPRSVAEDVATDIVDGREPSGGPAGVEAVAEQDVGALGVEVPQHPVVGDLRRVRPAGVGEGRVVR